MHPTCLQIVKDLRTAAVLQWLHMLRGYATNPYPGFTHMYKTTHSVRCKGYPTTIDYEGVNKFMHNILLLVKRHQPVSGVNECLAALHLAVLSPVTVVGGAGSLFSEKLMIRCDIILRVRRHTLCRPVDSRELNNSPAREMTDVNDRCEGSPSRLSLEMEYKM